MWTDTQMQCHPSFDFPLIVSSPIGAIFIKRQSNIIRYKYVVFRETLEKTIRTEVVPAISICELAFLYITPF